MADSVALYSPSRSLRAVAAAFLGFEGLRVVVRARLPEAPPHARIIFLDVALAPSLKDLRRFVIAARLIGSEVALLGHWSRSAALEEAAAALRLTAIQYPIHPRRFLDEVVVNPFFLSPDPDINRGRLVQLAGQLYEREGLVTDPERLAAAVAARMTELLVASFPVYLQIIAEGGEIAALAGLLVAEREALFQPSALFRRLDSILEASGAPGRLLIWRPGSAALGLSAAALAGERAEVVALEETLPHEAPFLDQAFRAGVPADFRSVLGAAVMRDEQGRDVLRPGAARCRYVDHPDELAEPFDLVIFPLARNAARGPGWLGELERALAHLIPGDGRLLLMPRERLLVEGLPLVNEAESPVAEYRRVGARSRA